MYYFASIPAIQIQMGGGLQGPIPTRPLGLGVEQPPGTVDKLCLCNLLRKQDEERQGKKKRRGSSG